MALNMDDLIGSMQHGFHAGDRGNELNEIRESLKVSLGQQPCSQQLPQQPNRPNQQQRAQWDPRSSQQNHNSLDADVAMLSADPSGSGSSRNWPSYQYQQPQSSNFYGASSYGSQGSTGSSSFGYGATGYVPAPANTPQQTPVETSALARQLQTELEKARETQGNHYITEVDERTEQQDWPPSVSANISPIPANSSLAPTSPSLNSQSTRQLRDRTSSPKYINGFSPSLS